MATLYVHQSKHLAANEAAQHNSRPRLRGLVFSGSLRESFFRDRLVTLPFMIVLYAVVCITSSIAQSPNTQDNTGVQPYQNYAHDKETINLATGALNLSIPLLHLPGRSGHDLDYAMNYDNQSVLSLGVGSYPVLNPNSENQPWPNVVQYVMGWSHASGWRKTLPSISYATTSGSTAAGSQGWCLGAPSLSDTHGSQITFGQAMLGCFSPAGEQLWGTTAADDQGNNVIADLGAPAGPTFYYPSGERLIIPLSVPGNAGGVSPTTWIDADRNGNTITYTTTGTSTSSQTTTITDTLGRQVVLTAPTSGSVGTASSISYQNSNGQTETITFINGGSHAAPSQTLDQPSIENGSGANFGLQYPPAPYVGANLIQWVGVGGTNSSTINISQSDLSAIVLPNGQTYTFQYDAWDNLIKVTYPDGGYTRYDYQKLLHGGAQVIGGQSVTQTILQQDVFQVVAKHVCTAPVTPQGATVSPVGANCPIAEETTTYVPSAATTPNNWNTGNSSNTVTTPDGTSTVSTYNSITPNSPEYMFGGMYSMYQAAVELSETTTSSSGQFMQSVSNVYAADNAHLTSKTTTLDNDNTITERWTYQQTNLIGTGVTELPGSSASNQIVCSGYCSYTATSSAPNLEYLQIWNPVSYTVTDWNGNVLKTVATTWQPPSFNPGQPFLPAEKASETVYQGATSTVLSKTIYNFDNYSFYPMTVSGAGQHSVSGLNFTTSNSIRGNITSIQRWRNTDSQWLTSYIQYNDAGSKVKAIDPKGNWTSYSYTDSWGNSACAPGAGNAVAYPTKTTNVYGQSTTTVFNSCTGSVASTTDPNGQTTLYSYDAIDRAVDVVYPEVYPGTSTHAEKKVCYSDTGQCQGASASSNYVIASSIISPSVAWETTETDFDGIGRTTSTKSLSDPYGIMEVDTSYDSMERVASVSNPYRPSAGSTSGFTTHSYDPLSRKLKEIHTSDGTYLSWAYSGMTTNSYDETGREWTHINDALDRLVEVLEPSSTGADNVATQYQYDSLGNLLRVDQWGGPIGSSGDRVRTSAYDTVSELVSAQNSESGLLCYGQLNGTSCTGSYDLAGNLQMKTDSRGIVTYFTYDNLNRVTSRSYSDGTPSACFAFQNGTGNTATNQAGKLLFEWTQTGACASQSSAPPSSALNFRVVNSYDAAGRITSETQCPYSPCAANYTFPYNYDLAGNPIGWTNGMPQSQSPLQFTMGVDAANRLNNVSTVLPSAGSQILFRADTTTATNLGVPYGPFGLQNAESSINPNTNQASIATSRSYDARGRILSELDSSSTGNPATGQIFINFNEQQVTKSVSGTPSTGSYQIAGSDKAVTPCPTNTAIAPNCLDYGVVNLIIVPQSAQPTIVGVYYQNGSSASALATSLASAINSGSSLVSAIASNGTVQLTSNAVGSNTNYTLASNVEDITTQNSSSTVVSGPSFTVIPSGSTMTGGSSSPQTVTTYDSGTITATAGNTSATISWSQSDSSSTIASRLAYALQTQSGNTLLASSSGGTINVQTVARGASQNVSMTVTATNNTSLFPTNSVSASATSLNSNQTLYGFTIPSASSGYAANGDLLSVSDSVMGTWTYNYDQLNRLTNAAASSGIFAGSSLGLGYDAWGNRLNQTVTAGSGSQSLPQSSWNNYNTYNQVTASSRAPAGFGYASGAAGLYAGQATYDGLNRYAYDGDGRLCAVQSSTGSYTGYTYDAEGIRVSKETLSGLSCTTQSTLEAVYLVDLGGDQVTELNGSYGWTHSNVFAHGRLIATYDSKGTHYHFDDILGTRRVQASAAGTTEETCTSFPFGDQLNCAQTSAPTADDATEHHFTGKERDTESGLDYFGARYYASTNGAFISPDWSSSTVPVPYADLSNPQSLNLYAYAQNNPITHEDLTGHEATGNGVLNIESVTCGAMSCPQARLLASMCLDNPGYFQSEMNRLWGILLHAQDGQSAYQAYIATLSVQHEAQKPNGQKKAQQQTGRQPDGSYVAPTGPGSEIYNRTHGGKDDQVLHPPDDTKGQCVTACKYFSGITAPTTAWKEGPAVSGNSSIPIGTAIATFGPNGKYPTNGDQNSGIYMGQGKNGSILILDQWPAYGPPLNTPAHPPQIRTMQLNDSYGHSLSNSASAYHVIIVP